MKGERGDFGMKGDKGEPGGGGYYDTRYGGGHGIPGNPGLPVRTNQSIMITTLVLQHPSHSILAVVAMFFIDKYVIVVNDTCETLRVNNESLGFAIPVLEGQSSCRLLLQSTSRTPHHGLRWRP